MSKLFNYWDIIHYKFNPNMAAEQGWGIVFDNSNKDWKQWGKWIEPPILGYVKWKTKQGNDFLKDYEFGQIAYDGQFTNDFICEWHVEHYPEQIILERIRQGIYVLHKRRLLDNLSLIEILDKLNEYNSRIS